MTPKLAVRFFRIWAKYNRQKPTAPKANTAEKIGILVILLVGGVQACIYNQQKNIMKSSSGQTDQLICAANIQADAAKKNAKAAEDFAKISSENLSFYKAITRLTVESSNVIMDGYMPITHDDKTRTIRLGIKFLNTKKTPAYNVRVSANLDLRDTPPKLDEYDFPSFFGISENPLRQGPTGAFYTMEDKPGVAPAKRFSVEKYVRSTNIMVYVWGRFIYSDFPGEERNIPFCRYAPTRDVLAINPYTQPYKNCPPEGVPKPQ